MSSSSYFNGLGQQDQPPQQDTPLIGTLRALRRRGVNIAPDLERVLALNDERSGNNNNNNPRSSMPSSSSSSFSSPQRPQPSSVTLLLAVLCLGSGVILLFISSLFGGTLPAFVIPSIHHGWSQETKSNSCRRAAFMYFILGGLLLFWGVIVGWCRWRLCVLFGLRVDHVGKRMLGHQRYYRLRGRNVPTPSVPYGGAQQPYHSHSSDDEESCQHGRLLSGDDGSGAAVEMTGVFGGEGGSSGNNGGDVIVRRRGNNNQSDCGASVSALSTSYTGGSVRSRGSPNTPQQPLRSTTGARGGTLPPPSSSGGFGMRLLRRVLMPGGAATTTSSTTSQQQGSAGNRSRVRGGGVGKSKRGGSSHQDDGGIYVNPDVRDTLDPTWMSDDFVKHLVKNR